MNDFFPSSPSGFRNNLSFYENNEGLLLPKRSVTPEPFLHEVPISSSSLSSLPSVTSSKKRKKIMPPPILIKSNSSMIGEESIFPESEVSKLENWGVVAFSKNEINEEIFKNQGFSLRKVEIGSGNFARVYQAFQGEDPFICKMEKTPRLIDFGEKFWRHSHFASIRLELPHLVQSLFFIVTVRLSDGKKQKFFLPSNKIKEFGQELQQIDSKATVELEAQIIEQAPGKTLAELLKSSEISFHPDGIHFQRIVEALNKFLKQAYAANFIHRDLKPENIMYDPVSGIVTIIDTGESSRLQSREKSEVKGISNPSTSTKRLGTTRFMSPRVIEGSPYGSEADFFSAAMVLLNLISNEDFNIFVKERSPGDVRDSFLGKDPVDFLRLYLEAISKGRTSQTEEILNKNSSVKSLIELYFQISSARTLEEEESSKAALATLKRK